MIKVGDVREVLKGVEDNTFHCCVTSPPYYGLRDYDLEDQIGLEQTPEEYITELLDVFREVRRTLKKDGTLWLNIGDSYCGYKGKKYGKTKGNLTARTPVAEDKRFDIGTPHTAGVKNKDMIGIPWKVAMALRDDGWYLRQDIIWYKPNPTPESVRDRCTRAHEYIFLLSKSPRYFYDYESVKVPTVDSQDLKNRHSVWEVPVKPFKEAHFATYPEELIEHCVLAGCPEGGIVLDPFLGSGTTGVVALKRNRNFYGIELNTEYAEIARKRLEREVA